MAIKGEVAIQKLLETTGAARKDAELVEVARNSSHRNYNPVESMRAAIEARRAELTGTQRKTRK